MNAKLILGGLLACFCLARSFCPAEGAPAAPLDNDSSDAFFTNGIIQRVRVQLDPTALANLRQDSRRYVRATATVGDTVYADVGLHLKGGLASFQPLDRQPCLTLKFNKFIPGQKFHDMEKLHLNSELFRKAGVPAARVTHARVQLNGRDLGFYVLVEGFDKPFLRRHFASTDGNLYDGGARADVMDALKKISGHGPDDRADLKVLASAAGGPASNRLARLQQVVDMDRFYSFLALEVLMAHWDGYAMGQNNYKLYRDPTMKRFVFLPHGMDQMFQRPQGSILPDCAGLVAWGVLNTPEGRQRHRDRCAFLFTNLFSIDWLTNRIDALEKHIGPAVSEMSPRLGQAHEQAVTLLRQNIASRLAFLERELMSAPLKPLAYDSEGVAQLTNWVANLNGGDARFSEVAEPKPSLQIKGVGEHLPFFASWRRRVLLSAGHYQFKGNVLASGFTPLKPAAGGGVCFRISDYSARPASVPFVGEVGWIPLMGEFDVSATQREIELVCEVRAFKGTVWVEKASLELVQRIGAWR